MDSLCLKAGIQVMTSPFSGAVGLDVLSNAPTHIATAVGRSSVSNSISVEKPASASWGFSFKHPLRSLWPGGRSRYDAIAVDDAVSVEEKEDDREPAVAGGGQEVEAGNNGKNESWVLKILHVRSRWKGEGEQGIAAAASKINEWEVVQELERNQNDRRRSCECGGDEECDAWTAADCDDDHKIEFDRDSFSKLLRRVSLREARLYAQMSYLGNLAYSICQIKPRNLLKNHGLRFVTSSLEKKELPLTAEEEEKASAEVREVDDGKPKEPVDGTEQRTSANRISASTAYQVAASAASYLHTYTKSVLPFRSSNTKDSKDSSDGESRKIDNINMMNAEVASLMATTDSVTAVVAAKEEVKQAVADDLKSTRSSPCEWFICDDDKSSTRLFIIQGSESLASWQANLLFEPIQFEGLDVLVHRGIYEAAKGIYEQMLPEVRTHLQLHGDRAHFRFTGHSLGGSLSLLINLMLLIRGEVPSNLLLPVITFGSPSIMCGGDRLLRALGLPRSHVQAITIPRDIVPRAFSCTYPNQVADLLKAVNVNFRNHPCLSSQRLLYAPMGEFLILQPDEKFSPPHHLLPSGCGLYLMSRAATDDSEADKEIQAAQSVFLNSPHPLEILSDPSAYGSGGSIQRDHDMNSYLKSVRNVIRQELNHLRKAKREQRRRVWWPLVAARGADAGIIVRRPVATGNMGQSQLNFAGMLETRRDSFKRFSRLVASQHMHLLVLLLFPARLLIVGAYSIISFG